MRRLITALAVGALSTGLIIAPAIANPVSYSASAEPTTQLLDQRFQLRSDSCLNPGASGLATYGISVIGFTGDAALTQGIVELIDGSTRTRVASEIDIEEPMETFHAVYYRFKNPRHLDYRITLGGLSSQVYVGYNGSTSIVDTNNGNDNNDTNNNGNDNNGTNNDANQEVITKVAVKKSTKVTVTSPKAKKTTLTVTNPAGQVMNVQSRVKGTWKTVQKIHLSDKATQKVTVKTTAAARKTGKHEYRVVIARTPDARGTTQQFNVTTVKARQKVAVKAKAQKRTVVLTVKSSVKTPSKLTLQKKVGKSWKTVASKKSSKAATTFAVKKSRSTYRVVVKSTKGLATTAMKTVRVPSHR